MIWKESYKIGDPLVDKQHKELFDKTEKLLYLLREDENSQRKEESINMVLFLKDYAIKHFSAEEELQERIKYKYLDEHVELHKNFINSVLAAEKKMIESDFSMASFKEFTGFLVTWLTYHVAGADQKIKTGMSIKDDQNQKNTDYIQSFAASITSVLNTMIDPFAGEISYLTTAEEDGSVRIQIEMIGDCAGKVSFTFPENTVFSLVKALTSMDVHEIDDMSYSVLSEIANLVSGNAATDIASTGKSCEIHPPEVISDKDYLNIGEGFCLDCNHGQIGVTVDLEESDH